MSTHTHADDSTNSFDQETAAERLREKFPMAVRVSDDNPSGRIRVTFDAEDFEDECAHVGSYEAPRGFEFRAVSLHDTGRMAVTFRPEEDG